MNISIIGTGIYGIALALHIANNKHHITMWSENGDLIKHYNDFHDLKPITDAELPKSIKVTNDLGKSLESADLIVLATGAKYIREVCINMKKHFNKLTPICIASKGIENTTCAFLSDIVRDELKAKHIAVISGPTFAADLINNDPASLTIASNSKKAATLIREALESNTLKLRTNNDLNGTELCGSIKNVIAIAAGIIEGLGYSESTRAFLLTESLHDIKELLFKMECNPKTILSYAGIGDLILTCSSKKSRNYSYGVLLGEKASQETINNYLNKNTVEGYYTLLSIKELTKNRHIRMPIINIIYDIAINHKEPNILIDFLINKN